MPPRFPRVRFNKPADFKAFHSDGAKGKIELCQQDLRESNADLVYVTAMSLEEKIFQSQGLR